MVKQASWVVIFSTLLFILSFDIALPQGKGNGASQEQVPSAVIPAPETGRGEEAPLQEGNVPISSGTSQEKPAPSLCGIQPPAGIRPLAVKIDNAPQARPQSGLSAACIVYEHLSEGGLTRFTAIYYGEEVPSIGPVRSARRVDFQILPQYQAVFAHVGGSPAVMERLRRSDILDLDQFWYPGPYYTLRSRTAPHNIYTSTSRLRQGAMSRGWGMTTEVQGLPVTGEENVDNPLESIIIPYSASSSVEYRYDAESKSYRRFTAGRPHLEEGGKQIEVKNVVVQEVDSWYVAIIEDAGGAPSLDFNLVGEGKAWVFHTGYAFEGKWVRPSLEAMTQFYDDQGRPIPFVPGNLWIALVPHDLAIIMR